MNTVVLKHHAVSTLVIATHAASVKHCRKDGGGGVGLEGGRTTCAYLSERVVGYNISMLDKQQYHKHVTMLDKVTAARKAAEGSKEQPTVLQPAPVRPGPQRALAASAEAARRAASSRRCWIICDRGNLQGMLVC